MCLARDISFPALDTDRMTVARALSSEAGYDDGKYEHTVDVKYGAGNRSVEPRKFWMNCGDRSTPRTFGPWALKRTSLTGRTSRSLERTLGDRELFFSIGRSGRGGVHRSWTEGKPEWRLTKQRGPTGVCPRRLSAASPRFSCVVESPERALPP